MSQRVHFPTIRQAKVSSKLSPDRKAMFHTFEGFENPTLPTTVRGRNQRQQSVGRRVTTLRACTSCRHRKIKCDGEKPCEACRWYKKADLCQYSDPRPSRRCDCPLPPLQPRSRDDSKLTNVSIKQACGETIDHTG